MFTGLVETTGVLRGRQRRGPGFVLQIETELSGLSLGESIAVSGACLTVSELSSRGFDADVSKETVDKTTLGEVAVGARLNLERSLRVGDRLGGHLVTGHVDGVARVLSLSSVGEATRVRVAPPAELMGFLAAKGSVTLDGVSLTINAVEDEAIELMLIPHTQKITTLGELREGSRLNLEVDLIARYVINHLHRGGSSADLGAALMRAGFVRD